MRGWGGQRTVRGGAVGGSGAESGAVGERGQEDFGLDRKSVV